MALAGFASRMECRRCHPGRNGAQEVVMVGGGDNKSLGKENQRGRRRKMEEDGGGSILVLAVYNSRHCDS